MCWVFYRSNGPSINLTKDEKKKKQQQQQQPAGIFFH